jgi:hypothetical protein
MKIHWFESPALIFDVVCDTSSSAKQQELTHISPGNPQTAPSNFVIKFEHFGSAPVPPAHAFVFHPFGVGKRQGLHQLLTDIRGDVGKPQVVGEDNFQISCPFFEIALFLDALFELFKLKIRFTFESLIMFWLSNL